MNESDLSDEALEQWRIKTRLMTPYGSVAAAWNEAVRRAKSNPWQLFKPLELKLLKQAAESVKGEFGNYYGMIEQIEAELERRKTE